MVNFLLLITTGLTIAGFYGFFAGYSNLVISGGIAVVVEILIGFATGELRSINTIIFAILLGIIFALKQGLPSWYGCMVGLCFEGFIINTLDFLVVSITLIIKKNKPTAENAIITKLTKYKQKMKGVTKYDFFEKN